MACFGCAPLAATTASAPRADRPAAAKPDRTTKQAAAMAKLYQRLCLKGFPAPARLAAALRSLHASKVPAREVATYLHTDPGRAWRLRVHGVRYVLTVENPPYHTCALRRMTPAGLPDTSAYTQVVRAYAHAHHLAIKHLPKRLLSLSRTTEVTAFSTILAPPGSRTARETSLLLLTSYRGHADHKKRPWLGGGPGVAIRMAHQIVRPFRIDRLP